MSWIPLKVNDKYEINTDYPYQIRRKSDGYVINEWERNGYYQCKLNRKTYRKHRLIAIQFLPNNDPVNKYEVDHIDRNSLNNHLSNLRWVSPSDNNKNRSSFKKQNIIYLDELPNDWVPFELYNGIEFEGYSYSPSTDKFYYDNGAKIRVQNLTDHCGYKIFQARDITGKYRKIYVDKWKRDEGLI